MAPKRGGESEFDDIDFRVSRPGAPAEQLNFKNDVDRTLSVLRAVYAKRTDRCLAGYKWAYERLLPIAQLGLVGSTPSTAIAASALTMLQAELVDREAGRIKNSYMIELGRWALIFAGVAIAAYFFLEQFPDVLNEVFYRYRNVFLVWAGCMAGAWASFASRKVVLVFTDLGALEEDRVEPPLRLVFVGVLTTILALIFVTGFANVIVGGFSAANVLLTGSVATLVGAFAGLAEKALPAAMMQRAQTFISSNAK